MITGKATELLPRLPVAKNALRTESLKQTQSHTSQSEITVFQGYGRVDKKSRLVEHKVHSDQNQQKPRFKKTQQFKT